MAELYVGDFMRQYRLQFFVGLEGFQQTRGDVNPSRRCCERIGKIRLDRMKAIAVALQRSYPSFQDTLAGLLDAPLDQVIGIKGVQGVDLPRDGLPEPELKVIVGDPGHI